MRIAAAAVPAALLVASVSAARRRSVESLAAALLGCTPQVWSTIAHVNPSGLAIAGGIATTTAWLDEVPDRRSRWLLIAGLVAMLLPRRDGPVWACALLGVLLAVDREPLRIRVARLGRGGAAVLGSAAFAAAVHALTTPGEIAITALASPALIIAGLVARWGWRRSTRWRRAVVAGGPVTFAAGVAIARSRRVSTAADGLGTLILGETGTNLLGTISDLSWLDVAVPQTFVFVWFISLGCLVGAALLGDRHWALIAAGAVACTGIGLAWLVELTQDGNGGYFQGRYYLPLMVAAPLLAGHAVSNHPSSAGVGRVVGLAAMAVSNAAFLAAGRRWGVGAAGTLNPLDWDTYGMAVPPAALVIVHLVGTATLASVLWQTDRSVHSPA
jgi:hypothetical protein